MDLLKVSENMVEIDMENPAEWDLAVHYLKHKYKQPYFNSINRMIKDGETREFMSHLLKTVTDKKQLNLALQWFAEVVDSL